MSLELKLIVLRSSTPSAARDFYAALGFEFSEEQHGRGPLHYAAACGANGAILEIYPLRSGDVVDPSLRLGFAVEDLEKAVAQLASAGAVVASPIADTQWGRRAVVVDPDGRSIELYASK